MENFLFFPNYLDHRGLSFLKTAQVIFKWNSFLKWSLVGSQFGRQSRGALGAEGPVPWGGEGFAGPARLPTAEQDLKTTICRTGGWECTEHLNTN